MKSVLKIIVTALFICHISLYGQKISDDSLLKKARKEIYVNPDSTINIANQLLKKEKDINKSISIYMLLSTANIAKRNFDESLKYILKAKELAQKTNDIKTQATVLISVAIQYQQMELFSKSLETLNEADVYIEKLPENSDDRHTETARSYAIRGMIYKSQSNSEIALEKFLISIKNFEKVSTEKSAYANMSIVYYNIGYCYLNLNQMEKAHLAFLKSVDYAKIINAKSLEAFALKGMAEMYKQNRENQTALNLLIKAENLSKNIGDLVLNEGIYKEMADNYLATGKQNLYQEYNKKYFETRFKREQNELSSINHSINNHNKETLKKSQELKAYYTYLTIIILCIGAIFISSLLYFILKTRKQNAQYQRQIQQLIRS
jgi:tetratricopeptide (TPR) repeat protein